MREAYRYILRIMKRESSIVLISFVLLAISLVVKRIESGYSMINDTDDYQQLDSQTQKNEKNKNDGDDDITKYIVFKDGFNNPDSSKSAWNTNEKGNPNNLTFTFDNGALHMNIPALRKLQYFAYPFGMFSNVHASFHPRANQLDMRDGTGSSVAAAFSSVNMKSSNTENHPFPKDAVTNRKDDIRLGACYMEMTSVRETFAIGLTNNGIWAIVDTLKTQDLIYPTTTQMSGNNGDESGSYAFTNVEKIASRRSSDKNNIGIIYDKANRTVSFMVDGVVAKVLEDYTPTNPNIRKSGTNVALYKSLKRPVDTKKMYKDLTYSKDIEDVFEVHYYCATHLEMSDPNNRYSIYGLVSHNIPDGTRHKDENIFRHPIAFVSPDSKRHKNGKYRKWGQGFDFVIDNVVLYKK